MPSNAIHRGVVFTPPALADRLAAGLSVPPGSRAIFDPSCGEGALLLAALRSLPWQPRALLGIETDPKLAARARASLADAVAALAPDRRPRVEIQTADALDPELPWPADAAILANPPWVSYSGRHRGSLDPATLERYRSAWPSMRSWPSSHGAFLERIAGHVGAGRRSRITARALLPAAILELERYSDLRRAVTRECALSSPPEDLGESAFADVLEPTCLLSIAPAPRRSAGSDAAWRTLAPADSAWITALRRLPRLPPSSFGDPGVHTGNAARELLSPLSNTTSTRARVRAGRDLAPYQLARPALALRVDLEPSAQRYFRIAPLERYLNIPVLLRQTASRPIAALHTSPTYFRNSLLACTPPLDLDPGFVVAVLNSSIAEKWHRLNFRDARQRTFPQVKVAHLRSLPFPILRRREAPAAHDAIAERVRSLAPSKPDFDQHCRSIDEAVATLYAAAGATLEPAPDAPRLL